jgi:hypothetical protein
LAAVIAIISSIPDDVMNVIEWFARGNENAILHMAGKRFLRRIIPAAGLK